MSQIIANLFSQIQSDPWREKTGFSTELEEVHKSLQEAVSNEEKIIDILNKWLQKYQPCLFGRLAARLNMLSFCILTEEDMNREDQYIQDKIQDARSQWTRGGFNGKKSGFILFVLSPKLAFSVPNKIVMSLAKQLCSYYLLETIDQDIIYTDEIWLEKPGPSRTTWEWIAGVNYFCANGDGRWWQDHRFPGGMAFSVNSVGHMAKACGIANIMNELNRMNGVNDEMFIESKVDSLNQALEFAMRTIDLASDSVSGKATELIPVKEVDLSKNPCPINLPKQLDGKNCKHYKGYYHTDVTVPAEYFRSDIERPESCKIHELDFTYLHDQDLKNPDFIKMGKGRRIRSSAKSLKTNKKTESTSAFKSSRKSSTAYPIEVNIASSPRLYKAITTN